MIYFCKVVIFLFVACVRGDQGDTVDARFQKLEQEIVKLQNTVVDLQRQVDEQNDGNEYMSVAFTAGLSRTITNMGSHQQIVFDHVITNVGNGYSPSHGHFTAPIKGVYVFFVVITNTPGYSSSVTLLRNGGWIGYALAHGGSQNNNLYVTSTIAVTIELQQGDEVWVQNEYAFTSVEELYGGNWSTFSGHLY
ncbi:complement C1q-like protein 4 [Ruditapes philippinarum]|uniref:complement C1q-like protein 4 n=1 Tax=Ruditapes philippinarum TaxID=129788 RepID=UPI00295B5449|nr:complement C1q-like protein 4 [Ruditapes philippinarum]